MINLPADLASPGICRYADSLLAALARFTKEGRLGEFFEAYTLLTIDPTFPAEFTKRVRAHETAQSREHVWALASGFLSHPTFRREITSERTEEMAHEVRALVLSAARAAMDLNEIPFEDLDSMEFRIHYDAGRQYLGYLFAEFVGELRDVQSRPYEDHFSTALQLLNTLAEVHRRGVRASFKGKRDVRLIRILRPTLRISAEISEDPPRSFMSGSGPTAGQDARLVACAWAVVEDRIRDELPANSPFFGRATDVMQEKPQDAGAVEPEGRDASSTSAPADDGDKTLRETCIGIAATDPSLSYRRIAKRARCSHTFVQGIEEIRRYKALTKRAGRDGIPEGFKRSDGSIEATSA